MKKIILRILNWLIDRYSVKPKLDANNLADIGKNFVWSYNDHIDDSKTYIVKSGFATIDIKAGEVAYFDMGLGGINLDTISLYTLQDSEIDSNERS